MTEKDKIPFPLRKMLEHLEIDSKRAFEVLPEDMVNSITVCEHCKMHQRCDYFSESRYFQCPNRQLFDRLEDLLD